jgi:hypothetical protein
MHNKHIPKDFAGCSITVSTLPSEPHVITSIDGEEQHAEADVTYVTDWIKDSSTL